ncbi:MAG TPA: hypothetical protein VMO26_23045 [Vicinamibacterales bacterium]|nr:hypothetical protein [Vicinamibacterales bacterium]
MAARRRAVGGGAVAFAAFAALFVASTAVAQPSLTPEQQETFLENAKVVRTRDAGSGVTGTLRATLSDGVLTHDAHIQTVDVSMTEFRSNRGTELNFKDTWRYNVAAYRLNQLLQLGRVPVSVERRHRGQPGSFTWWVDDVLMDEGRRLKTKASAPDALAWNEQMWHVRLFDQLIQNVDRNVGNLVIDKTWSVWMIDHSRAFRLSNKLSSPKNLTRIERGALERLRALDADALSAAVGNYLTSFEKRALLQRRDAIVALFDKGGPSMIYERSPQ